MLTEKVKTETREAATTRAITLFCDCCLAVLMKERLRYGKLDRIVLWSKWLITDLSSNEKPVSEKHISGYRNQ